MKLSITKATLDRLYIKYNNKKFIQSDPIQFLYKNSEYRNIEIIAFISSAFSFGSRKQIIIFLNKLFNILGYDLYNLLIEFDYKFILSKINSNIKYRFIKSTDIIVFLYRIHIIICDFGDIYSFFKHFLKRNESNYIFYLSKYFNNISIPTSIIKYNISSNFKLIPQNINSTYKRINLFLRWMIRKDNVDLGLWNLSKSNLLIPLDVHVMRISRLYNITSYKTMSYKTVVQITNILKTYDPNDPIKYDFSLFGLGIELNSK